MKKSKRLVGWLKLGAVAAVFAAVVYIVLRDDDFLDYLTRPATKGDLM